MDGKLTVFPALEREDIGEGGEVWLVSVDPTLGPEMKKIPPAVVVHDDVVGIVPLKVIGRITDSSNFVTIGRPEGFNVLAW